MRVLEYRDRPGDRTTPHRHPDSVLHTLSTFRRRLSSGGRQVEVELQVGTTIWLAAQEHSDENSGETETHVIFIELKEARPFHAGRGDGVGTPRRLIGGACAATDARSSLALHHIDKVV